VRFYRGQDGSQQFFIKEGELEELAETELGRAMQVVTESDPIVDIERFVEHHLGAELDLGADLEPGVLGLTELRVGQPARVLVSRDLSDSAFAEEPGSGVLGRWRATVAHEAIHVMLHRILFELNADQGTFFDDDGAASTSLMRCLKRDVGFGIRPRDPREWQANKGMAALLMPRPLFAELARHEKDAGRTESDLVAWLATTFAVSRQAAGIRLSTLGFVEPDGTYVHGLSL
jgi:hypothetical protein